MGFYNFKAKLKILFEKRVLETIFQFRIPYCDKKRWEIKCVVEQYKWWIRAIKDKDRDFWVLQYIGDTLTLVQGSNIVTL